LWDGISTNYIKNAGKFTLRCDIAASVPSGWIFGKIEGNPHTADRQRTPTNEGELSGTNRDCSATAHSLERTLQEHTTSQSNRSCPDPAQHVFRQDDSRSLGRVESLYDKSVSKFVSFFTHVSACRLIRLFWNG